MEALEQHRAEADEAAAVTALLMAHHPEAQFDVFKAVTTAGFLCAPGAPGSRKVRVGHRCPFPSSATGRSFPDVAAEEYVLVEAYADLLREHGWTVNEVTTTRPGLLVFRPTVHPDRTQRTS